MTAPVSVSSARYIPALRKATDLIIKVNPRSVTLTPHSRVDKGGGLYDVEEQRPRATQTFSIEPAAPGSVDVSSEVASLGGANAPRWAYVLIGRHDAVVEVGDTWQEGETLYRVVSLSPKNDYEKRAVVVAFGKDPNYGV